MRPGVESDDGDLASADHLLSETYAAIQSSRELMAQVHDAERQYLLSIDRSLELIEASQNAIKLLRRR